MKTIRGCKGVRQTMVRRTGARVRQTIKNIVRRRGALDHVFMVRRTGAPDLYTTYNFVLAHPCRRGRYDGL